LGWWWCFELSLSVLAYCFLLLCCDVVFLRTFLMNCYDSSLVISVRMYIFLYFLYVCNTIGLTQGILSVKVEGISLFVRCLWLAEDVMQDSSFLYTSNATINFGVPQS
jgi:hypothetical protein